MQKYEIKYISNNEDQTIEFGQLLAEVISKGDVICLNGNLGAGKTVLVRGIAKGLNIKNHITSPSYTIMNIHYGDKTLYHFDAYRINSSEEMLDIGFEDYCYSDGVCIIEWAENIIDILPEKRIWIEIKGQGLEDSREIEISLNGLSYEKEYNYIKNKLEDK